MKIKKELWLKILASICLAVAMTYFFPGSNSNTQADTKFELNNTSSIIGQQIKGVSLNTNNVTKIYYQGMLLGVLVDSVDMTEVLNHAYEEIYAENFPGAQIRFNEDIYVVSEKTYLSYEDKDEEIIQYLYDNDMFVVQACRIDINGEFAVYVKNKEMFEEALEEFVLNFVDADTYARLKGNITIEELTSYGTQDFYVYIEEKLSATAEAASAENILMTKDDVFEWLCYGDNPQYVYYTVQQLDTIEGVGSKNGLTAEQVVAINDDLIDVDQVISEGMELNVTYFTSPINVVVEQQRFVKETIYQETPLYKVDNTGMYTVQTTIVEGKDGYQDTLYTDIYVNGILTSYRQEHSEVKEEAVRAVIIIPVVVDEDGNESAAPITSNQGFRLPVNNAKIICKYGCYKGHNGVDFRDRYDHWGKAYACGDGVIMENGYNKSSGWYYKINHYNGYIFRYCHFASRGWCEVGEKVKRGQYIGNVGMTGAATGPHVHVAVWINGVNVDACTVLPC